MSCSRTQHSDSGESQANNPSFPSLMPLRSVQNQLKKGLSSRRGKISPVKSYLRNV